MHLKVALLLFILSASGFEEAAAQSASTPESEVIVGRDSRVVAVYTGYSESSLDGIVADINRALAAPKPPEDGGRNIQMTRNTARR